MRPVRAAGSSPRLPVAAARGGEYGGWWAEAQSDKKSFITTWQTTAAGETIAIALEGKKIKVDWGDGSDPSRGSTKIYTHSYATPGSYQISVSGNLHSVSLLDAHNHNASAGNSGKLMSIDQWGRAKWKSMASAFAHATNMVHNATDKPNLSGVKDMKGMFYGAYSFNGDISDWDVSKVTDMNGMFYAAPSFNADISGWDVSGVKDMGSMFSGAHAFSQNLGEWYVVLDHEAYVRYDRINATVGTISAQNKFLDGQNPTYGIDTGGKLTSHGAGFTAQPFRVDDGNVLKTNEALSAGTYKVNITASGDGLFGGGSHFKVVDVVIGGTNPPKISVADSNMTAREGSQVTMRASVTNPDGGPLAYHWAQMTQSPLVELSGAETLTATFTAPLVDDDTTLVFAASVSDMGNMGDVALVTVLVKNNQPPSVDAGDAQTVDSGSTVALSGTASDPDGDDTALTYSWSQTSGSAVTLSGADTQTPTFQAPTVDSDTDLIFTLTVNDGLDSATDSVTVTVNPPPTPPPEPEPPILGGQQESPSTKINLEPVSCSDTNISQLISSGAYNVIDNRDGHLDGTTIKGTSGADLILASDAGNTIKGDKGKDCIIGGAGNDNIFGNQGNDTIYGGAGNDTIHGGSGNDTISCGTGDSDVADGGKGADTAASDCETSKNT